MTGKLQSSNGFSVTPRVAARLDEGDETESSTRFRSDSLRLRQRDLDDAPSGRQERDEEVEATLLSLEEEPTEALSNRAEGFLANHFCRDFRIPVRPAGV